MPILPSDFTYITEFIKKHSGIFLEQDKEYLLESRLNPIVGRYNLGDFASLVGKLKTENDSEFIKEVIEAMTTNETSFFRDTKPFENLVNKILPHVTKDKGDKTLKIWSAACSTGQEAYSIAMSIKESVHYNNLDFSILATDLDEKVMNIARKAVYSQFEVQRGAPISLLVKYFSQENEVWHLQDKIKKYVDFRQYNLLSYPSNIGVFDVIFCRNVLIYFDVEDKKKVIEHLCACLSPNGVLVLGSAETIIGHSDHVLALLESGLSGAYVHKEGAAIL